MKSKKRNDKTKQSVLISISITFLLIVIYIFSGEEKIENRVGFLILFSPFIAVCFGVIYSFVSIFLEKGQKECISYIFETLRSVGMTNLPMSPLWHKFISMSEIEKDSEEKDKEKTDHTGKY